MNYTSINIQGNLISEEILQQIEQGEKTGQLAKDFGFEPGVNLRSEIEYAWSRIKLDWKHFLDRTTSLPAADPYGTTLARKWMTGFYSTLGFELSLQKSALPGDNNQGYTISHTCDNLDNLPLHIVGFHAPSHPEKNTLDIRSSGGASRMSPHATVQEYLNVTEHLYAMVTNGYLLRLVRDSGRLVKLTYIEFDLKRMLDEDKYSEFTLLYRLLHASRFPKSMQETEESLLEKYYQDSIESGNRIRDGLSDAVKESLIEFGNGLLSHPDNDELREKVLSGRPDPQDFFHQLLRLIYRLLFLMVTEERDLIFPENETVDTNPGTDFTPSDKRKSVAQQREIYYSYYSIMRLRSLSGKRYLQESDYSDLWQGMMKTFSLFEINGDGRRLGILPLGSELFSDRAMWDLEVAKLSNKVLLSCISKLNEFEDDKHNLSYINYRALDVEELGSVYEGLLELEPVIAQENGTLTFTFKKGSGRSTSGSHYTPEDLVKPLIQHSLEYLIEDRVKDYYKKKAGAEETKKQILDLKVCDVACGSGHILLSAARRIALEVARVETGEQQPNPTSFRHSLKEVIKNCIYGVDKNPLAVELCKVALWLESHNPGEPLSFLDHRIKCGDAIVGLAHREELQNGISNEAYKRLPGDDKEIVSTFLKKNRQERTLREKGKDGVQLTTATDQKLLHQISEINQAIDEFSNMPENTPEEIEKKERAYTKLTSGENIMRLKRLADIQVLPFFLVKSEANKEYLVTDAQYHRYLRGEIRIPPELETKASVEYATIKKFFHWFLEFPEVFQKGGFDCILGNPPFLGGKKISTHFGNQYLNWIKSIFIQKGSADFVGYFFRRINKLIAKTGFQSLISSNSISQGDTREVSLDEICKESDIIFATKNIKWPGAAAVSVSIVCIYSGEWSQIKILNNSNVDHISPFLDDEEYIGNPFRLIYNSDKSFIGNYILGKGFILRPEEAENILNEDSNYRNVIKQFLTGDDLNKSPSLDPSRYVIFFRDWPEERCKSEYPICWKILEERVKPQRDEIVSKGNQIHTYNFWEFWDLRPNLYKAIEQLDKVIAISRVTKQASFSLINKEMVPSEQVVIIAFEDYKNYSILNSTIHEIWAWKYASTMGSSTLRYSPTDTFETFPFPKIDNPIIARELIEAGKDFENQVDILMTKLRLGKTKVFNLINSDSIEPFPEMSKIQVATNLTTIRDIKSHIDHILIKCYKWQDVSLHHGFYENEVLPEEDRIRFTISPEARKEILKRLLLLNHERYEEEILQGLHKKKDVEAFYEQKGKPVPAGIEFSDKKSKTSKRRGNNVQEPEGGYGGLFG